MPTSESSQRNKAISVRKNSKFLTTGTGSRKHPEDHYFLYLSGKVQGISTFQDPPGAENFHWMFIKLAASTRQERLVSRDPGNPSTNIISSHQKQLTERQ